MKLSVIIPVYNVAPYLRECLGSIAKAIEQCKSKSVECKTEVEVICVDDCSTDGSYEILKELSAALHFKLKLLHFPENRGVSAARNRGLDEATGDWFCFLDGDDVWAPDILRVAETLIRHPSNPELVSVGRADFTDGEKPDYASAEDDQALVVECGSVLGGPLYRNGFTCQFYRRDVFVDIRFSLLRIGEDRVFSTTCFARCSHAVISAYRGYYYRQRKTSASNTRFGFEKVRDAILHMGMVFVIAAECGKSFTPGFKRALVAQFFEEYPHHIRRCERDDRKKLWPIWSKTMDGLVKSGLLTRWGALVARFVRFTSPRFVALILAEPIFFLKTLGVHR